MNGIEDAEPVVGSRLRRDAEGDALGDERHRPHESRMIRRAARTVITQNENESRPMMQGLPATARLRLVTICRNDMEGLRRTLASVDVQTIPPFEHVVLDGASTDGTAEWLARSEHPSWRRVTSEADAGIYDAMNKGLGGDWDLVMFLNSGDLLANRETLAGVLASWHEHGWRWTYGRSRMVHGDGSLRRVHDLHFLARLRFLAGVRSIPHQATVLSRSLVDEIGLHRLDVGISADQEYLLRCWRLVPPHRMSSTIAVCDVGGLSAQQPPGAFARQMAAHRDRLGALLLRSRALDGAVTSGAVLWDTAKRRGSRLRARLL